MGERLIYPPLAGVGVDRLPNGLSSLCGLGQHVPVGRLSLKRSTGRAMQRNLILAAAAMPDQLGMLPAVL
jgi:hypothetical protein